MDRSSVYLVFICDWALLFPVLEVWCHVCKVFQPVIEFSARAGGGERTINRIVKKRLRPVSSSILVPWTTILSGFSI